MTIFRFIAAAVLFVAAALLPGCVGEQLPQDQGQRADRIGPLQIHIHADYNVFPSGARIPGAESALAVPGATGAPGSAGAPGTTATTQPAVNADGSAKSADPQPVATITHNTTTMTVHVSTQGSTTQAQTATGGSPGPVSNTPSVSVPVSVSPAP